MNIFDEFHHNEQRVLDRLVDGELSAADRRRLLAALDDEPGAWRRCALAFLEAQSWGWQLSRVAAEPIIAQPSANAFKHSSHAASRLALWAKSLALAASLALAFTLGTRVGAVGPALNNGQEAAGEIARSIDPTPQPLKQEPSGDLPETITLVLDDENGAGEQIELPIAAASPDDTQWTTAIEPPAATRLWRKLQRAGLEVSREQNFWPVNLSDGRQVIVPIESVDIRYPTFVYNQ